MITNYPITNQLEWPEINIDTSLTGKICKKTTAPEIAKQITNSHIQDYYNQHTHWYTDGSLDSGVAGIDIYCNTEKQQIKKRVTDHVAIVTAEMTAISIALDHILEKPDNKIVIFTDSLSTLQALKGDTLKNKHLDIISQIYT